MAYDMDLLVEAELASVPEEEQIKAWNAFESEGDRYLKPVLQRMIGTEELKGKELDRAYEWLRLLRLRFARRRKGLLLKLRAKLVKGTCSLGASVAFTRH